MRGLILYHNKNVFFFMSMILTLLISQVTQSAQSSHAEMQRSQNKAAVFLNETAWIVAASSVSLSKDRKDLNKLIIAARYVAQQIETSKKYEEIQRLELSMKRREQAIMALFVKQVKNEARQNRKDTLKSNNKR
jgi:hypothetical protein